MIGLTLIVFNGATKKESISRHPKINPVNGQFLPVKGASFTLRKSERF